jgi:hypothetical protein
VVRAAVARVARIAALVAAIGAEAREATGAVPGAIVIAGAADRLATGAAKVRPTWISRS